MKELAKTYDPKGMEDRIYKNWLDKKYFHAEVDRSKKPFTIVMPPPNITGKLHMGHALDNTMQDILIRYKNIKRIYGYKMDTYWSNIATVESYYKTNMDFLKKEVRDNKNVMDSRHEYVFSTEQNYEKTMNELYNELRNK